MLSTEDIMRNPPLRWSLVLLVCLMAVACHDRREPVKPTVDLSAAVSIAR
jgi:hypothetical protein